MNDAVVRITAERLLEDSRKAVFQHRFPEFKPLFEKYLTKPGCGGCRSQLVRALASQPAKLAEYYGQDAVFEVDVPETRPSADESDMPFVVLNVPVSDLEAALNRLPPAFYALWLARDAHEITAIARRLGDGDGEPFVVINCHIDELAVRLQNLPFSGYRLAASRSGQQITVALQPTS